MKNLEVLRNIEGMELQGQIEAVVDMLEDADFQHIRNVSRRNTVNDFYFADGCNTVLCVVTHKTDDFCQYVLLDKTVFDVEFKDTNRTMSFSERHDKSMKVLVYGKGYSNMPLHKLALKVVTDDMQIDHQSHNTYINTSDFLRVCIAQENRFNQRYYSKIDKDDKSFSVPDKVVDIKERMALASAGFRFDDDRIYSPSYKSFDELYKAVDKFESKYLKEFRYNPFRDFSETWYVVVLWKMLGLIDEVEVADYQRDFFKRTDKKLAQYYRL